MTEVKLNDDDLEIGIDGEVPVFRLRGLLYSGRVNEVMRGKRVSTCVVRDGYKDGEELLFSEAGELSGRLQYSGGLAHGRVEYFHPGGALQEEASFEFGICLESTCYDQTGAVTRREKLQPGSSQHDCLERFRRQARGS